MKFDSTVYESNGHDCKHNLFVGQGMGWSGQNLPFSVYKSIASFREIWASVALLAQKLVSVIDELNMWFSTIELKWKLHYVFTPQSLHKHWTVKLKV